MFGHMQNGREGLKKDDEKSPLRNAKETGEQKSVPSVSETVSVKTVIFCCSLVYKCALQVPVNNSTDILKKMLKISEDLNAAAGSSEPKPPGKSISVDEMFAVSWCF